MSAPTGLHKKKMDIIASITNLYNEKNWQEIVEKYHDHPARNTLLWVYPSETNFKFLQMCLEELNCDEIMSVGCGSGLLEWMINAATGIPVSGIEVDGDWWRSKYAPPTFITLHFTPMELDRDTISLLQSNNRSVILFCYFNNRTAFEDYLKYFIGEVIVIIGPHNKGVHTDPLPFDDVTDSWVLYKYEEIRSSKDYIVVYKKKHLET